MATTPSALISPKTSANLTSAMNLSVLLKEDSRFARLPTLMAKPVETAIFVPDDVLRADALTMTSHVSVPSVLPLLLSVVHAAHLLATDPQETAVSLGLQSTRLALMAPFAQSMTHVFPILATPLFH
jgi:hypothetical protein